MSETMEGKICLITGANAGIGRATAAELVARGATVVMAARSRARGEAAVAAVREQTGAGEDRVWLLDLDLASLASVRAAAATFLARHDQLHVLINNAGLMLSERQTTMDGFESTFGINHLGHFLFTSLLLDTIKRSAPARIVNLASDAHRASKGLDFDDLMYTTRKYSSIGAYADSKLANILFTLELATRLDGSGVVAHAVHPGVVRSGFAMDGDTKGVFRFLVALSRPFMLTPEKGARTSIHVATSDEAAAISGRYWARSRQRKPTAPARDADAARRLWEVSEELLASAPA